MKNTLDSSIVKLTNYRSVWGYIHKNKQATIPQIAKSIGPSLPTVTRAIDYGVAEGIINPDGVIGAERGRKAQVYKLNADYMHFLLIYLDSDVLHTESMISEAVLSAAEIYRFVTKKYFRRLRILL